MMISTRSAVTAAVLGLLAGGLFALWTSIAEALGTAAGAPTAPAVAAPNAPVPAITRVARRTAP